MPTIHVATADGIHVLPGDGRGETARVALGGRSVTGLTRAGDHLWAVVDRRELWRGVDDRWERVADVDDLTVTCIASIGGSLYVGTSGAHLLRLDDRAARRIEAFDAVEGRQDWYTPWGGPPDTRSIANWDDDVYVNVHVGGIAHTSDEGATWTPTIDIHADVHQVTTADGGVVLAACADGMAVSVDRGATWSMRTDGLDATYCRAVAVCGDAVLLSSSNGPRGGRASVARASLDGGAFDRVDAGPGWFDGNIDTFCLDALPDGAPVAAIGTADGRVFVSTDGGSTWEEHASDLTQVRRVLVMP